jgi:hypothetical protein
MSEMPTNEISGMEIAKLLIEAHDDVERTGGSLLIKWDGQRERGSRYTLLRDAGTCTTHPLRTESGSLEGALRMISLNVTQSSQHGERKLCSLVSALDAAADAGYVINIRIDRSTGKIVDHLVIIRPGGTEVLLDHNYIDLQGALSGAIGALSIDMETFDP